MQSVGIKKTVKKTLVVDVESTEARIDFVYYDFLRDSVALSISFMDDAAEVASKEAWLLTADAFSEAMEGIDGRLKSPGSSVERDLEALVSNIENNEQEKERLMATGALLVVNNISIEIF